MISHLGAMWPVADGLALAARLDGKKDIALAFSGEGGTSEGDIHEALNVAAVWDLPVLFLIENNGYGLSTPTHEQFRATSLADRAPGYGIRGYRIDGNNVLTVYHTVHDLADRMRQEPQPILLECLTFRMRGHEEASGTRYVPPELFEQWQPRDPIDNYEAWLRQEGLLDDEAIAAIRQEFSQEINEAVKAAWEEAPLSIDVPKELASVYAEAPVLMPNKQDEQPEQRLVDAISDGLRVAMELYPDMVIMGQDVAEYGGRIQGDRGLCRSLWQRARTQYPHL